jgi:hypothetical protein
VHFTFFRLAMILSLATMTSSACSVFDSANPANADPKISFEHAQKLAQDNNIKCLWARGADPKTGSYHCVPMGKTGNDDTRASFAEIGLRVVDGGVKLPEGAGTPLRVVTIDGRVELTPQSIDSQPLYTQVP